MCIPIDIFLTHKLPLCFCLARNDILNQQYWQIYGGGRIFEYWPAPPGHVGIDPAYVDKITFDASSDTGKEHDVWLRLILILPHG